MRRFLGVFLALIVSGLGWGIVAATPAGALAPTITAVTLTGNPATPVVTITGQGFGAQPSPNPASGPCAPGPDQGLDYGTAIWFQDTKPLLGSGRPWNAGLVNAATGKYSCIGLHLRAWSDTRIVFALGAWYDNSVYQLTQGDLVKVVVKGTTFAFTAHYAGGTPQLAPESWCDPSVSSCASVYVHWLGSKSGISQPVKVHHLGSSSFGAVTWNGGYLGIQNGGNSVSGVVGPTAVFSLGGDGVRIGSTNGVPNPNCEMGFDTGSGASCRVPLPGPIVDGTTYRFVVARSATTGWITGKVVLPGGTVLTIGRLLPPPGGSTTFDALANFIEYFGPDTATADVPPSTLEFTHINYGDRASRLLGTCGTVANNGVYGAVLSLGGVGCL